MDKNITISRNEYEYLIRAEMAVQVIYDMANKEDRYISTEFVISMCKIVGQVKDNES